MKLRLLVALLPCIVACPGFSQSAPNPLLRPPVNLGAPLPSPNVDGKAPLALKDGSERDPTGQRPSFDGWYVAFVMDKSALLRASDHAGGGSVESAPKPGSPGFGVGASDSGAGKTSPAAVAQELEVESGSTFVWADALLQADIRKGRVTLTYLGAAASRRNVDNPSVVFSGRVMSNPIGRTRSMEKPDDRYVNSVKPAPNSVKNVMSGAAAAGASGAPAQSSGGGY